MSESDRPAQIPIFAPPPSGTTLTRVAGVRFIQDAAVSAYIKVSWTVGGKQYSKDLGPWKPIGTQAQYVLRDEGVPNGVTVFFSSYVSGVGEYPYNQGFECDHNSPMGAEFRQTGTAFKGWFDFRGLYNL